MAKLDPLNRKRWWFIARACLLFSVLGIPAVTSSQDGRQAIDKRPVIIRQFDVGQGDAALITTPEGRAILIDAGPDGRRITALLLEHGIDTLDLVIASHNHADHIGGMPDVFSRFVVRAYMDNGVPHTTSFYRRTLTALEREPGLQYLSATRRTITVGSLKLHVLPPARSDGSQNNNSVGVILEYGAFRALFTGDSETAELHSWLSLGLVPVVSMLKAAHHGSLNGVTEQWRRATAPQVVTVSVGTGNTYGHPAVQAIHAWMLMGARVFRTDRDGTIEISGKLDGEVSVKTRTLSPASATVRE